MTLGGLCWYCGIGGAFEPVFPEYVFTYCCFVFLFALSFVLVLCRGRGFATLGGVAHYRIEALGNSRLFRDVMIASYIVISLLPLCYPTFRLPLLWNPPSAYSVRVWNFGLGVKPLLLLRLTNYVGYVIWPLYIMALYQLRRKYGSLAICIALPAYLGYCATGYMGRGTMAMGLMLYLGAIWLDRPRWRGRLVLIAALCAPFVLVFFAAYEHTRVGRKAATPDSAVDVIGTSSTLLLGETAFPQYWKTVRYSGRHADLAAYFKWLLFLPVPKVVTGEITGCSINYEIAEILTAVPLGRPGFTVALTGPVTESVYIYGPQLFWIHAAFIGVLAGALCALAGACRSLTTVQIQYAITFGYVFSRAGIGATAPLLVNAYLGLYLLVFWSLALSGGAKLTWKAVPAERPDGRETADLPGWPRLLKDREGHLLARGGHSRWL